MRLAFEGLGLSLLFSLHPDLVLSVGWLAGSKQRVFLDWKASHTQGAVTTAHTRLSLPLPLFDPAYGG